MVILAMSNREFVSIMISINEQESWYFDENVKEYAISSKKGRTSERESMSRERSVSESGPSASGPDPNLRHTINGYIFGNMPLMTMKKGERVRWYLLTLGDSNNFHTPHWHGNTVSFHGHNTDVIALSPARMETVDMVPDNPVIWLFHCHVSNHMAGGMMTRYQVLP